MGKETEERETREPFSVDESSFDFITDVEADSDTLQEGSSPLESVESTDAEEDTTATEEQETETDTATNETATESETETNEETEELTVEHDGKKYDFTTAPKDMREIVKSQNRLVNSFVRDKIEDVQNELKQLSPTAYAKLEQTLVQQSADANSDKWAEYLVKANPKAVVKSLVGADSEIDLDAIAEMCRIYTEDSEQGEDLRAILEIRNPEFVKPTLTSAEKQELEAYRQKEKANQNPEPDISKVYEEVFDYVDEKVIAPLVKEFGLMPETSDTPQITQAKQRIVNSLATIVDQALTTDPETKDDYASLLAKIKDGDKAGAMAILPSLLDKIESETASHLGFIKSSQAASLKARHTPAKKPPTTLAATGKTPAAPPKPMTLKERLDNSSDEDILRGMGLS